MTAGCGTVAGYQTHHRRNEPVCEACRDANADYWRNYRQSSSPGYVRGKARQNARSRAMTRLADQYPAEFEALLAEELDADTHALTEEPR